MVLNKRNVAAFLLSKYYIASGKVKKINTRAASREFILSVYFHDPSKKLFESCVRWFKKNGYSFISTDDLAAIASGTLPFPSMAVLLTVDDGWKDNKPNIAAVAIEYKVPVTIFASTGPIASGDAYWWSYIEAAKKKGLISESVHGLKQVPNEKRQALVDSVKQKVPLNREALTVDELKEISQTGYISIGSHTVSHPILTKCSDQQSDAEIRESRKILETWLNKDVRHFAYPNGEFTDREINFLKDSGYKTAYTTIPQYITPRNFTELYTLPRFDVLENVSFAENICRMTGAWFNKPSLMQKNKE